MSDFERHRQRIVEEFAAETLHDRLTQLLSTSGYSTEEIPELLKEFEEAKRKLSVQKPVTFDLGEIVTLLMTLVLRQKEQIAKLEGGL